MKVLVVNCGSSSLKYQLLNMEDESVIAKGICERIGIDGSFIKHTTEGGKTVKLMVDFPNHQVALEKMIELLTTGETKCIESVDEIGAVGHRVVHGGEKFSSSAIITKEVEEAIRECIGLAPLHNPANLTGIDAARAILPNVPMVGVFDTAFHQTMPKKAYMYAIPKEYYEKYGIRKYGFHGTSHKYVAQRVADMLGKPIEETKIIVCHLGNGASVCAVDGGISVETSMGFTPLQGLAMGTRSGDVDPAVISFIMEKEGLSAKEVENILNKKSGILGVSGIGSDFREIEDGIVAGDENCRYTMDVFQHRLVFYIGGYAALMNGVDAIAFAGGLGENNAIMRAELAEMLSWMGVKIDLEKNKCRGVERDLSATDSKVRIMLVPTNEELMIARDAVALINK
ncbi:acetate kinase [Candidatus Epulonipiscium fishelsonii]|uniref:Acetate kinase n=1 Tax=Candidatus Epulonipiscium fishelsonii TaxID=77094 RepID=A0ACC8XDS6_9FIRM|nr:acetate kinase [Epulopiscium sp. SCG-B05WGA-EpuloA1]ONI41052.1 acetate kinase [Epulopiscium sp. SCG-B11WGA-EpuloA1]